MHYAIQIIAWFLGFLFAGAALVWPCAAHRWCYCAALCVALSGGISRFQPSVLARAAARNPGFWMRGAKAKLSFPALYVADTGSKTPQGHKILGAYASEFIPRM